MARYLILLRGINVGGKNKLSMAALKAWLEAYRYANVSSYINSDNILLDSTKSASAIQTQIEKALPKAFKLDNELIKVLALTRAKFKAVVSGAPKGFAEPHGKYHSDAIFLMGGKVLEAMTGFSPREGVDKVWPGKGVIYHQRLSSKRTKSRLSKIMATPFYKSMTIRSWQTTLKLLELLDQ